MADANEPERFKGSRSHDNSNMELAVHPLASGTTSAAASKGTSGSTVKRFVRQQVPDEILNNPALNEAIKALPANYNFEIHKTIWRLKSAGSRAVALQFPEGLLMYATTIADIITHFAGVEECMIMGDVTYGACCIDDFSAKAMGADFLVHYGHSCLVPVDNTTLPCLYVFVDIAMDVDHLVGCVKLTFPAGTQLVLAGTIQFSSGIQAAKAALAADYPSLAIPKCKPLSPGETLGCTAPVITQAADAIVFVADGRFHLEALMIANPTIPAYRYDPYGRILTHEHYDQAGMRLARRKAIEAARPAKHWGLVLGTLGRQGNPRLLETIQEHVRQRGLQYTVFLVSELSPQRLALVEGIDAWVQVACPRLSIDWGEAFTKPTLTPYEAMVALGIVPAWWEHSQSNTGSRPSDAGQQEQQDYNQALSNDISGKQECCNRSSSCVGTEGNGCRPNAGQKGEGAQQIVSSVQPGLEPYPMDYYAANGGPWNSSYHKTPQTGRPPGPVPVR